MCKISAQNENYVAGSKITPQIEEKKPPDKMWGGRMRTLDHRSTTQPLGVKI